MVNLGTISNHVILMLTANLSKALTYHNINHTLDVALQCKTIAIEEGIKSKQILLQLQIAALYHDAGFIFTYQNHEEKGCEIAREELPGFGLSTKAIEKICELIMATKVPQAPANHLQKIICDADLDYLGREDFFETANKLYLELMDYKLIKNKQEWEERQLIFLQAHKYFTKTSQQKRTPAKMEFISKLIRQKRTAIK